MSPRMEEREAPYKRLNGTGVTYPGSKHCVTDRKISESLTVTLLGYMKCRCGRLGPSPSNTRPALTETKGMFYVQTWSAHFRHLKKANMGIISALPVVRPQNNRSYSWGTVGQLSDIDVCLVLSYQHVKESQNDQ